MKPFIQIAFPTGQTFELPAVVIAENRAKAMLAENPGEFADIAAAMQDTVELFDDDYQLKDWALNNMNPDEYMPYARMIRFKAPEADFQAAEWSHHPGQAITGEIDGDNVLKAPLEYLVTLTAASRQLANVTVINNADGQPGAAVAVFVGPTMAISAFIDAVSITANHLTGAAAPTIH